MSHPNKTTNRLRSRKLRQLVASLGVAMLIPQAVGCSLWKQISPGPNDTTVSYHQNVGLTIEYPEVAECATPAAVAAEAAIEPNALADPSTLPTLELSLPDAIAMAMRQSPVIRTLGAQVTPQTIYDPALTASSASGTEAALAAFDAQYAQSLSFGNVDQPNNIATGGLGAVFTPSAAIGNNAAFQNELSKRTATGSQFSLRHVVNYDYNNRPFRQFTSDFIGWVEAEWRQPLMRGAGLQYNRIVGSGQVPGQYNGVLIARINEDIALADFENAVIGLVSDVEQAYWDLVTGYRILDALVKGRESAMKTYSFQRKRLEGGVGRPDEEAQAQSQYYQFEANVQSQLGGENGLYALEQRLRYLLGMPATDGKLIRPTTEPSDSKIVFDWSSALSQALDRRVEVRRQRFLVKQSEFALYAARLNKRPTLDLVGSYRVRGLGDHLIGDNDDGPLDGLYSTITDGNYQEWAAAIELAFPVGLRQASVAVANAKLGLQRERALLAETELSVSHDLSSAARNLELTHSLVLTNYNRYQADILQEQVLESRYREGIDNINFVLQAQRQVVQSEAELYRSLANYNLAIRDLHRQKGSLLAFNQVQLAEGAWEAGAAQDAHSKGLFLTPRSNPGNVVIPRPVTRQTFDPSEVQSTGASGSEVFEVAPDVFEAEVNDVPAPPAD